jgi:hypothetical protein
MFHPFFHTHLTEDQRLPPVVKSFDMCLLMDDNISKISTVQPVGQIDDRTEKA